MALEYNVRTGKLVVRRSLETIAVVGLGYAGATAGLNNPEMEHVRNVGPIPQGTYFLRETRHPRFRAPAFECVPTHSTCREVNGRAVSVDPEAASSVALEFLGRRVRRETLEKLAP